MPGSTRRQSQETLRLHRRGADATQRPGIAPEMIPASGSFRNIFMDGHRCILRTEAIARSAAFGVDCKLVTLAPSFLLFNRSGESLHFEWAGLPTTSVAVNDREC